jgi:hypothetical protein
MHMHNMHMHMYMCMCMCMHMFMCMCMSQVQPSGGGSRTAVCHARQTSSRATYHRIVQSARQGAIPVQWPLLAAHRCRRARGYPHGLGPQV